MEGIMALISAHGWEVVAGTDEDDIIYTSGTGANIVYAGDGVDKAVYFSPYSTHTIEISGDTTKVSWSLGGTDIFHDVERLEFSDATIAISPEAFQVYRLYQAALNRAPDTGGVSFWINHAEHGVAIKTIAEKFISSNEFVSNYGADTTNEQFVDLLYHNVLQRDPDPTGYEFWTEQMDKGLDRADMLIEFADSHENIILTSAHTHDGIFLI
jgi:hypothetical protein